ISGRHTRSKRDGSSDVCSSHLAGETRSPDLLITNQLLYLLSYNSMLCLQEEVYHKMPDKSSVLNDFIGSPASFSPASRVAGLHEIGRACVGKGGRAGVPREQRS